MPRFVKSKTRLRHPIHRPSRLGLGCYWTTLTHFGRINAHEAVPAARGEVARGLQIDPSLPEAHALLGFLAAMYDMDWAAAERHFDFPLAKKAGFPLIRPMHGGFQFLRGSAEQAIELAQPTIAEDPLVSVLIRPLAASLLQFLRQNSSLRKE